MFDRAEIGVQAAIDAGILCSEALMASGVAVNADGVVPFETSVEFFAWETEVVPLDNTRNWRD